ncbi:GumC domain-containing protein [Aquisphaera giovannonii]|uniref:hypothetical protein n=1 Tax=Aquisphaera giovannonii TaxID=406548 RepID=UPI00143D0526|nr:hypothetical protein [Aquisphaera giovannonii]
MTDANDPDRSPSAESQAMHGDADESGRPPEAPSSRRDGSGLAGFARRILIPWQLLSAPLVCLAYLLVEPTYWSQSLVLVERDEVNPFGPGGDARATADAQPEFLRSQLVSLISDPVLEAAFVVDPGIAKLPMFKGIGDPVGALRRRLDVGIVPNTNFIRIGLESASPDESARVVNAVTRAYKLATQPDEHQVVPPEIVGVRKDTASAEVAALEEYKEREIDPRIRKKQEQLLALAGKGSVRLREPDTGAKDAGRGVPEWASDMDAEELYRRTRDDLMQVQFQLIELETKLEARQEDKAQAAIDGRDGQPDAQARELGQQIRAASLRRDRLKALLDRFEVRMADSHAGAVRAGRVDQPPGRRPADRPEVVATEIRGGQGLLEDPAHRHGQGPKGPDPKSSPGLHDARPRRGSGGPTGALDGLAFRLSPRTAVARAPGGPGTGSRGGAAARDRRASSLTRANRGASLNSGAKAWAAALRGTSGPGTDLSPTESDRWRTTRGGRKCPMTVAASDGPAATSCGASGPGSSAPPCPAWASPARPGRGRARMRARPAARPLRRRPSRASIRA